MKLKKWLESKGMSQLYLAKELGVSSRQIWRLANGRIKSPKLSRLIEIYTRGEVTMKELTFPEDYQC